MFYSYSPLSKNCYLLLIRSLEIELLFIHEVAESIIMVVLGVKLREVYPGQLGLLPPTQILIKTLKIWIR